MCYCQLRLLQSRTIVVPSDVLVCSRELPACNNVLHLRRKWREQVLNSNAFGQLVRSYRQQRGWTQEELGERWGYTRAYVSQIEQGKRKLDSMTQVLRLLIFWIFLKRSWKKSDAGYQKEA